MRCSKIRILSKFPFLRSTKKHQWRSSVRQNWLCARFAYERRNFDLDYFDLETQLTEEKRAVFSTAAGWFCWNYLLRRIAITPITIPATPMTRFATFELIEKFHKASVLKIQSDNSAAVLLCRLTVGQPWHEYKRRLADLVWAVFARGRPQNSGVRLMSALKARRLPPLSGALPAGALDLIFRAACKSPCTAQTKTEQHWRGNCCTGRIARQHKRRESLICKAQARRASPHDRSRSEAPVRNNEETLGRGSGTTTTTTRKGEEGSSPYVCQGSSENCGGAEGTMGEGQGAEEEGCLAAREPTERCWARGDAGTPKERTASVCHWIAKPSARISN